MLLLIGGATARRYQYTGQGLRVRKWTSSNTSGNTYFVYNENAQLIGEYDNAGARVQEIIWLGNLPVGVIAGTAATPVLHYIESDHLGTPQVIVEATRNVGLWRWNQTNDPFGESTPNQNPDGDATSFTFNLRFAGQYRDSESGWYYNVHRYYDPATGRYLESDPIGLGGGISTYGYVGAAPLTAADPLGLQARPMPRSQLPSYNYTYRNGQWVNVARPPGPQPVPRVPQLTSEFGAGFSAGVRNGSWRYGHEWNPGGTRYDDLLPIPSDLPFPPIPSCKLQICGPAIDPNEETSCPASDTLRRRPTHVVSGPFGPTSGCRCIDWE